MSGCGETESFHDGHLDGLRLHAAGKSALFYLRTCDNTRFVLRLDGLERLHISDFREGSIIFDLSFTQTENISIAAIKEVYALNENQPEIAQRLFLSAQQSGLQLLDISSSYGASGIALFKEYSFSGEK